MTFHSEDVRESGKRVWRSHLGTGADAKNGYVTFSHYGFLSSCGQWVDGGSVRWKRTSEWCDSEAEALARLAPKIAAIGARMLLQATELLDKAGDPARSGDAAGIAQPEVAR
jgi:hypothetical protein